VLAIPNVAPATAHDARERGVGGRVSFATMVAGRGRTAAAVAAVFGPGVDDFAETKAVTLRRAWRAGRLGPRDRGVRHHDGGGHVGIDDRRELERACAAHVVDTPD
jgi:hypothetical protein